MSIADGVRYQRLVTLADVRAARPKMIFYGANTCWWTHDAKTLYRHPECGLPCDPRSGMLFQTDKPDAFLRAAERHPTHYGKHGLTAFEAALHGNVTTADGRPTCFATWDEYNELLDRLFS